MTKVVIMLSLIFIPLVSFAQEKTEETKTKDMSVNVKQGDVKDENKVIIKGKIETIAEDGNFIIINATKLNTTKEFLEEAYLEVGDNVEIIAEKDGETLKVVDYRYIFEDELESSEGISEGIISTEEKSAEPSGQNVPQVQEPAKKEGTTK